MTTKPTRGRPAKPVDANTFLGRVASRLRALRKKKGLSVERVAKSIAEDGVNVHKQTIYDWETGKSSPHLEVLPALAKVYRVTIAKLLPQS